MPLSLHYADLTFLLIGLSIFIDLVILIGSYRVRKIRKVRIVSGIFVNSIIVLIYLVSMLVEMLGYVSFSGTDAGILLAFSILVVFYVGILRGMS